MEPFPLFSLPILPLRKILEKSNFISLINLSICSKYAQDRIKSCRLTIEDLEFVFDDSGATMLVGFGKSFSSWKLRKSCRFGIRQESDRTCTLFHISDNGVETACQLMQDLFRMRRTRVDIKESAVLAFSEVLKTSQKLRPDVVCMHKQWLSAKEMAEFRTALGSPDTLLFYSPAPEAPEDVVFDSRILTILDASLLKPASFLTVNSERIVIGKSVLTSADLNEFVRKWQNAENPRLEMLTVDDNGELEMSEILEGLEGKTSKRRRAFFDGFNTYDCSQGMDVRGKDGRLATLQISPVFQEFHFFVWPQRRV